MKLKIGIALSVIVLIGCIIGFALPWYEIQNKSFGIINKETITVQYKWKDFTCQQGDGEKYSGKFEDDPQSFFDQAELKACVTNSGAYAFDMEEVSKTLNACLSFLIIGASLALGTTILQIILLLSPKLCRSCIWKVLTIGCSMATIAMLFVSFFTLFSIPKAFSKDTPFENNAFSACDERWCDKIAGSDDDYKWIPGGGWFATAAACFTSLVAGIFTLVSHR